MATSVTSHETVKVEDHVQSAEELLGDPEPWEPWETHLVVGSIAIALVGLVILGWMINTFILK